jgi:hypothetical protein
VFGEDGTGHLTARFKVGTTVYRGGGQRDDLRRLWGTVGLVDRLLRAERPKPDIPRCREALERRRRVPEGDGPLHPRPLAALLAR